MFQVRVHLEPRQELLRTLWNAYKAFQGEHEGGGLRDFTRALKLVLRTRSDKERAQALSAYTRVILALGAQSGFDPFNKACG